MKTPISLSCILIFGLHATIIKQMNSIDSCDHRQKSFSADFNGDGIVDRAFFLENYIPQNSDITGNWCVELGDSAIFSSFFRKQSFLRSWGFGDAIPVPGDYDGDKKTDIAVFFPKSPYWHILFAKENFNLAKAHLQNAKALKIVQWGLPGDTPTPDDYNGDGTTDIAIRRSGTLHVKP